ncbi:uncharacterized protein [Montipora foliosa]|uniref:uncharacterized protein n=1 Tax=Montipora foliosa TaxID=591990 RepID=UPI0035F20BA7
MKSCSFLVIFSLSVSLVNAFSTEEHVKRFFRPEHRVYLPQTNPLMQLEDESVEVHQHDESTKCLSVCEPRCDKLDIPDYLTKNSSFHQFEDRPINCVLASTVEFPSRPRPYQCKWLLLYLFDCCRACNAKYEKCIRDAGWRAGGPEFCYRTENYNCMCRCLAKHRPLDVSLA